MSVDSVRVSVWVEVDPATAFEIFTRDIGSWWSLGRDLGTGEKPRRGVMCLEPGVGGRLLEVYDEQRGEAFEVGRVRVWDPARRLVFGWRQGNFEPDQKTEVEVRFEPASGRTRVTVEHRGFAALPLDHPTRHGHGDGADFVQMWTEVWQELLGEAAAHIGRREGGSA